MPSTILKVKVEPGPEWQERLARWQEGYDRALRSVLERAKELETEDSVRLSALIDELEIAVLPPGVDQTFVEVRPAPLHNVILAPSPFPKLPPRTREEHERGRRC
jgi:hypothetical protein